MKGPYDVDVPLVPGGREDRPLQPRPTGDKAWARLHEFADLRGIPLVISDAPRTTKPKAGPRSRGVARTTTETTSARVATAYPTLRSPTKLPRAP